MWFHDSLIDLQIGGTSAQALDIDAPAFAAKAKCLESPSLACQLDCVDVLVASIVSSAWVPFTVLVAHGRAKRIEDGTRSEILRSDEHYGLALTLDLVGLRSESVSSMQQAFGTHHDPGDFRIDILQRLLEELESCQNA